MISVPPRRSLQPLGYGEQIGRSGRQIHRRPGILKNTPCCRSIELPVEDNGSGGKIKGAGVAALFVRRHICSDPFNDLIIRKVKRSIADVIDFSARDQFGGVHIAPAVIYSAAGKIERRALLDNNIAGAASLNNDASSIDCLLLGSLLLGEDIA